MDTMMKRIIAAVCLLLLLAVPASAQDWFWGATWGVSVADGTTYEYIDDVSFRNFGIEGRKFTSPNFSVGISLNWTVLDQKGYETTNFSGGTLSGTQFRYINAFPLLLTSHFYLGDDEGMQLYVGAGAGPYAMKRRTEVGLIAITTDSWHLGIAPEVGLILPFGWRAKGFLYVRYNYTSEAKGFEYQWWDVRIGLVSM